jgi:DNA-binding NarL/FixJ family response regulator
MDSQSGLHGLRVLVAEDEGLVALEIAHTLQTLGCRVVGPVPRVKDVIRLAQEGEFDAAILDVNLRGEYVFAALPELMERAIPVVLATGYSDLNLVPREFQDLPRRRRFPDSGCRRAWTGAAFAPVAS